MIPKNDEVLIYLKDALAYVDGEFEKLEKLASKYFPVYVDWLTEKLSATEPLTTLSMSVGAIFVLVIYIWYRNR